MKTLPTTIRLRSAGHLQSFDACNLALNKCGLLVRFLAAAMAVFVLAASSVFAASQTWDGGSTVNGTWSTAANWVGDPTAPGATSGSSSTDVATFNSAIANTWGNSGTPVVIDSGRNIGTILFDTASVGSYTIGSTIGPALITLPWIQGSARRR